jgi:hypothetical protein
MTTRAQKSLPNNRWNRAVREALLVPDVRSVLEATDEEIDQQLRDAGVDLAEIDAKAAETYERALATFGGGEKDEPASFEAAAGWRRLHWWFPSLVSGGVGCGSPGVSPLRPWWGPRCTTRASRRRRSRSRSRLR